MQATFFLKGVKILFVCTLTLNVVASHFFQKSVKQEIQIVLLLSIPEWHHSDFSFCFVHRQSILDAIRHLLDFIWVYHQCFLRNRVKLSENIYRLFMDKIPLSYQKSKHMLLNTCIWSAAPTNLDRIKTPGRWWGLILQATNSFPKRFIPSRRGVAKATSASRLNPKL